MSANKFLPFENDSQSLNLGDDMTFENGTDSIHMYGDFSISQNAASLKTVNDLISTLTDIKASIEAKVDNKNAVKNSTAPKK
jgi:hypothetical protein